MNTDESRLCYSIARVRGCVRVRAYADSGVFVCDVNMRTNIIVYTSTKDSGGVIELWAYTKTAALTI